MDNKKSLTRNGCISTSAQAGERLSDVFVSVSGFERLDKGTNLEDIEV